MTPLRLGSHYQLEERIGEGGLGVVWRGSDTVTGAACAIKVLRPEHAQDPATVARFVRERTALLRFRHPNVVVLRDMIVEGDQLALVMDLVTDGDLAAHRKRSGGTLNPAEATELTAQVCAGLAAAHAAGIVHRDLKPANILLDGGQVRLTDFGIALVSGETDLTTEGVFLGTLHYLAPEVIRGEEPTPACDCYAVGVTLYELLAGRPPFTGVPAAIMHGHLHLAPERPDGIPDAVWQVIAACLDKDPGRRPGATELEWALRDEARPPTAPGGRRRSAAWPGLTAAWDRDTEARATSFESGPGAIAVLADAGLAAGPAVAGLATETAPAGVTAAAGGPVPPGGDADGPRRPRGRRFWFGWAAGTLAVAVAAVIAVALTRSPGTSSGAAPGGAATMTGSQSAAGHTASASRSGAASTGTAQRGGTATPGTSPGTTPGQTPGQTGTAPPSSSRTAAASPTGTSPSTPAPSTSAASSPSATPSPSASASATPSATAPANTAWQCGASVAVTLATGKATAQTLQACIRVHNGKLALHGVLDGTVMAWHEQIVLLLEDAAGNVAGTYYSPVCTTVTCTFTMTTVPADGEWTVQPEWARYGGNIMSAGQAPGYVYF
ncbi:MAG TPA: serine/threonine-protein kinase [Trebonia sp.]|nr:serine/threonine-protein kinase [Trebonia sp.]